ncbi:MAG: NAD(P) transhydrogenase subunit alpha [Micromonosporaceae bacterium]
MAVLTVGVLREDAPDERRVALVPADVGRLTQAGLAVLVESGAGERAWFCDEAYADAGAETGPRAELCRRSDVLLCVGTPTDDVLTRMRPGQVLVGLLGLLSAPERVRALAERDLTAISFDGLPRTASRAQSMDALTSQANIAGYKAVLIAAAAFGRLLPMLITAAGTTRPAKVLVLGAGVAGLQAIGTARRLGAVVSAYDVRPSARDEVASMGAQFVTLTESIDGAGAGGYARLLGAQEQQALADALAGPVADADIVITTAQVPGRRPPLLVTETAVKAMRPGSVIVDLAAGPHGGNVALTRAGETFVTENGVTIVSAANLAATVPAVASMAYSRNISALLLHLAPAGELRIDADDEIHAGVVAVRDGVVTRPRTKDGQQ